MIWLLLLVPAAAGLVALRLRINGARRALLVSAALVHAGLVLAVWLRPTLAAASDWLAIDGLSLIFLGVTTVLFLAAAFYSVGSLRREEESRTPEARSGLHRTNKPERLYTGCLLLFLSTMTLVVVSRHLGLLWVAIEATTLASAPLIYHHRHRRSLEAAWKYLLICSVGIALALLGNFFLAAATAIGTGHQVTLTLGDLIRHAPSINATWLKAAFLLLLVGYGTKMGLVPMHTWLPDAHSEAPSAVSALLSGALLNCAFLGILRVQTVMAAAGLGDFGREQLVLFGLVSMAAASFFLITQTDFKRMLAYSSVEHMGVMALGFGLGGVGAFGAMLHAVNHSLAKAALFLAAGNILAAYGSKRVDSVSGLVDAMPSNGAIWLAGSLAIVGSPPFGLFYSELIILKAALDGGRWWIAAGYLASLAVAFVAILSVVMRMAFGSPSARPSPLDGTGVESAWSLVQPALLITAVLGLGLYIPETVYRFLESAASSVAGH